MPDILRPNHPFGEHDKDSVPPSLSYFDLSLIIIIFVSWILVGAFLLRHPGNPYRSAAKENQERVNLLLLTESKPVPDYDESKFDELKPSDVDDSSSGDEEAPGHSASGEQRLEGIDR